MTTSTQPGTSISDLLDAALNKQAYENPSMDSGGVSAGAPNPPTSGPGGGPNPEEKAHTEGAKSKENDANIKEILGETGVEGSVTAATDPAVKNPAMNATVVHSTPEGDPNGETSTDSRPSAMEPGTAKGDLTVGDNQKEASLRERANAWRKSSGELIADIVHGNDKLAASVPQFAKQAVQDRQAAGQKTGGEQQGDKTGGEKTGDKTGGEQTQPRGDIYDRLAGHDPQLSKTAREHVTGMLQQQIMFGRQSAHKVAAYLETLSKKAMGGAEDLPPEAAGVGGPPVPAEALMGGGGGAAPPPAAPPEAGGMGDPGMGMGGEELTEEDAMQIILELSEEMGIPPEQLMQLFSDTAMGGGGEMGGGEEMGGMPPMDMGGVGGGEAAPPPAEPKAASGGGGGGEKSDSDSGGSSDEGSKEDAGDKEAMVKYARYRTAVKQRARKIAQERLSRR